jgi:hypothetical protein
VKSAIKISCPIKGCQFGPHNEVQGCARAINTEGMWSTRGGGVNMHILAGTEVIWWKNFWCQLTRSRGQAFNHNDKTRIAIHFWIIMASDNIWLCQQDLKTALPVQTSNLIWPWAAVSNSKLVLFWWDSNQELNSKDIKDFLYFPMGIHAPL